MADTIYALSSGELPSGVAIIRISGPQCRFVLETMCANKPFARGNFLATISDPFKGIPIDSGLVVIFPGPNSFTGEDVLEFQVHGGRAVVDKLLDVLSKLDGLRHADAGEFTYRAFENGKLDLTQAEGIADLVASETENQRQLAFSNLAGRPGNIIEKWSDALLSMRAFIEAEIDFVDEDDIPGSVSEQVWEQAKLLQTEIGQYLERTNAGEIIRNGFKVALLGRPNSGKSSLINALAERDVAIVTDQPGTTRDVLNIHLNLNGHSVIVFDTAGVRDTDDKIEKEGIRRSLLTLEDSNLSVWLEAVDDTEAFLLKPDNVDVVVSTKIDLSGDASIMADKKLGLSSLSGEGLEEFVEFISEHAVSQTPLSEFSLFSSERQKSKLISAHKYLSDAISMEHLPLEIRSEYLRLAGDSLGAIVGKIDVEDLLGVIFSKFCVGK